MNGRKIVASIILLAVVGLARSAAGIETAPRISDREIVERLTRVEEGQKRLEDSLGAKIQANAEAIARLERALDQLRADMQTQIQQLRQDMDARFSQVDAQFERMFQLTLGILGAFAGIVAVTIGFALWDRKTMIRPFEGKVQAIEEELSHNRQRLHALLEALRSLGRTDEKVAEVLRQFQLL